MCGSGDERESQILNMLLKGRSKVDGLWGV